MKQYHKPSLLVRVVNKALFSAWMKWPKTAYYHYFLRKKVIAAVSERKLPYHVVFFVLNAGMWKYESLLEAMMRDERFKPLVIPYSLPWHTREQQLLFQNEVVEYCRRKGYPCRVAFDIENQQYVPAKDIKADFISYSQPYNNCHHFWRLERFWRRALVFNYPYGLPLESNVFNNLLIHNVAWKNFFPTDSLRALYDRNPITHGYNYVFSGNVVYDRMAAEQPDDCGVWKDGALHTRKRIIWAPHHTIGDHDELPFSTFLTLCDAMVDLARKYVREVEIAFKPHPMLRERLYTTWGKEKTEEYYTLWATMPNTRLALGDYIGLFKTSDAMIHDCSGFMLEYLYTRKPVLFVSKNNTEDYLSSYARSCFRHHYHAFSPSDVETFISDTVIAGNDSMKPERDKFYMEELLPPHNNTAAVNMLNEFSSFVENTAAK